MTHDERIADMPAPLRWFLVAFKQVGFPVLVCVWLAYQQFIESKNTVKTISEFKDVIISLKASIDQQTDMLRRRNRNG